MENRKVPIQPPIPDPEEGLVRPLRRKSDPDLGPEAMLVIIPADLDYVVQTARSRIQSSHDMGYFKLYRVEREGGGRFCICGPFLGAPHAAMGMEKMIALGVRRILVLGWCGSLQPDVRIGDLIIPTGARSEEGTSRHYPIGERAAGAAGVLTARLEDALGDSGRAYRKGSVWTTDAPYRETPSKILKYRAMGILGVDMEMSALITLGVYRSVQVAGLLVVSDELFDLKWRPGFRSPVFTEARRYAAGLILNILFAGNLVREI